MRIALLGVPGSESKTLAQRLSESMKLPLLPVNQAAGTDNMLLATIRQQLDASDSFVLAGFPATLPQAQALDRMLAWQGRPIDLAIMINFNRDVPFNGGNQETLLQSGSISKENLQAATEKQYLHLGRYYKTQNKLLLLHATGNVDADLNQLQNSLKTRMRHSQI